MHLCSIFRAFSVPFMGSSFDLCISQCEFDCIGCVQVSIYQWYDYQAHFEPLKMHNINTSPFQKHLHKGTLQGLQSI